MSMRARRYLLAAAFLGLLCSAPSATQVSAAVPRDLTHVFSKGLYLQDTNDDGIVDGISARVVIPSNGTAADLTAAANIAARLGFESSAFTPGLGALDSEVTPGAGTPPLILVGRENALVRRLAASKKIDLGALKAGQGLVALVKNAFEGADALVVAGADDAGTLAAGEGASARLPFVWKLRGDSIAGVHSDLKDFLERHGVRLTRSAAVQAIYERGKEQITTLTIEAEVSAPASAVSALEKLASDHNVGRASFTDRAADTLNYYGLQALEVRISGGKTVRIDRFGPSYRSNFPANPWRAKPKALSLASLYTIHGLLGDSRGDDLIPDETETTLIIGSESANVIGAVDLAARIGIEGTGVSLPLARVDTEIAKPEQVPNPILIGPGKLSSFIETPALSAGEGLVRVIPGAFGEFPALVVTGGDVAGVNAAAMYLARSVPYVWTPRKGETSFTDVQDGVRAFFRARSSAGQAAAAVAALEDATRAIQPEDVASMDATAYLEESSREVESILESTLKKRFPAATVSASAQSRYGPVQIFEDLPDLGWEVDELRRRFERDVLPHIKRGAKVQLEVLVSEGPELRMQLEKEFAQAVRQAGAAGTSVRVICAYKQGYSWLADYVLPALRGKPVASISIRFPTARPTDSSQPWYGLPIRWLQEIFPIDEIFARELKLGVDATTFEKVEDSPILYQVEAKDRTGRTLLRDEFAPRFVDREYFPQKPTARLQYTTGGVLARVDGQTVADFAVRTDPERFWDHYQMNVVPRMFEYARTYTGGQLGLEQQPFFRDLILEITMSEPDFRLNLDEERISSLDSLHEDLMFDTIDFWAIFSGKRPGSREVAPGRIMPLIHPVQPGRPPHVKITFKGNAAPTPRLVLSWKTREGRTESRTYEFTDQGLSEPRITAVRVRVGAKSVAAATATVSAKSFEAAAAAARLVENYAAMQKAGALREALSYPALDQLLIEATAGTATITRELAVDRSPMARAPLAVTPVDPGRRIVTWDHVIGPAELEEEIIPKFRNFPEINSYVAGRTYRGLNVWAMDVMLPIISEVWSQAKASALKPVLLISTRQHSNEVSATSAALRLMELFATDAAYRRYLKRMNVAYHPMENPDGAANHQEFYKLQPTYILHAGYWSSVARDVGAYVFDNDPLLPEALVRRKLYYTWLPDIYMNPHGYPSHEWVHQFAGYKVPWFLAFWIPRGYHINLHHLDDPNYPDHRAVGLELRDRIIEEVQGIPEIRAANERLVHRFEKYARRYEPDPFRLEIYKGMNILFDYSYSYSTGGPFNREIYVNPLGRRPGQVPSAASGEQRSFLTQHPQITVLDLGCDMPDETASPEWMDKIAARGQFGYLMSNVKLLYDSHWEVKRFEEDFTDRVRLSVFRPRPVRASRAGAERPTTSSH